MSRLLMTAVTALILTVPVHALAAENAANTSEKSMPVAMPRAESITAINEVRRGSMVTIEGVVQRIVDTDEFILADATGAIRIDVRYPNFVPVAEGERVSVRGFVDRDLFLEVYAREIVHADGRVSRLDRVGRYD